MRNYTNRKGYVSKLLAYKDKDLIKVVTGVRRSGKSTLLELYRNELLQMGVKDQQIVFLNFEEFELRKFLNNLDALYKHIIDQLDLSRPCYVFLDEVQNVNEFERMVDGLFVKPNIDVYITGSNAFFLSGELATLLSGRYIEISILPFSFQEYLTARKIDTSNQYLNYEALFFDYVNETSLPKGIELRDGGFDMIYEYLEAVYATIVEKDITQRHQINNKRAFGNITKFVAFNIGNQLSPGNIAKILKEKRPKAFFLENVKGLVNHDNGKTLTIILNTLRHDLDYFVPEPKVVNAKDFGVPQNRERIFIVGFRKDLNVSEFVYPEAVKKDMKISDIKEEDPVSVKYYLSTQYLNSLIEHRKKHESKGNGFGFEIKNDSDIAN
ncbi:MAG: DNA (cytosine-5-)-methyltransferase, partial [Bacteroidota bacterium]